jgi:hypothetical protein
MGFVPEKTKKIPIRTDGTVTPKTDRTTVNLKGESRGTLSIIMKKLSRFVYNESIKRGLL